MMKRLLPILITIFLFSSIPAHAMVQKENRLWQDESVYSIMVDRFNDGDTANDFNVNINDPLAYNGGDLQGIIDKLDYIHNMGFTAIRLSPIFDNAGDGYHGYWVKDFYRVDEHFGTMKTFQQLVKEAHKRKIKVLLDFVTNHVASSHPWVNDPGKKDWFHKKSTIVDWTKKQQVEEAWVDGLPDLNQDNPDVKKYLIDAAVWWIKQSDVDGYTLPEVNHVPISFWRDFSAAVKKAKKDFFLMGVPSEDIPIDTKAYLNAGLDSMFNYPYSDKLRKVLATTNQSFAPLLSDPQDNESANFLDNEYTVRFTNDMVAQKQYPGSRWKTALTFLYTTPGIPVIYYGTEIAEIGGKIPDNRRQMNFRANTDLIDYITKLGELRNQLPSLTRGTMKTLYDKNGMLVYKRQYKGETAVIAINNTRETQKVALTNAQLDGGKELRGLQSGDLVRSQGNKYFLVLDRDTSEIYVLAPKTGLNFVAIGSIVIVALLAVLFLVLIIKRSKRNQNE
jgi:glycosidase